MQFMIDYENTGGDGLMGVSCLEREDTVTIFYSNSASRVENRIWHQMCAVGCEIRICKLVQCRKNALDFYIASSVGETFGKGYYGKVGIVSRDKGFLAVCDYWRQRNDKNKIVIVGESIERCILHANENNVRTQKVHEQLKTVRIEEGFSQHITKEQERKGLLNLLKDEPYEKYSIEICDLVDQCDGKRELYQSLIKRYGRTEGLKIYRRIRDHQ